MDFKPFPWSRLNRRLVNTAATGLGSLLGSSASGSAGSLESARFISDLKIFNILTAACSLENRTPWHFQDKNGPGSGAGVPIGGRAPAGERRKGRGAEECGVRVEELIPGRNLRNPSALRYIIGGKARQRVSAKFHARTPPPCFHLALLDPLAKRANKAAFLRILAKLRQSQRPLPTCQQFFSSSFKIWIYCDFHRH